MSLLDTLIRAAVAAPDDRKAAALSVLAGEATAVKDTCGRHEVPEKFVTLRELSRVLGISTVTLWRYGVPGHELGGKRRFHIGEVSRFLESPEFTARAEQLKAERRAAQEPSTGRAVRHAS